jgi:hypothetical protein
LCFKGLGEFFDASNNFFEVDLLTLSKGVAGVAIGTAEIARGESHKNTRQSRVGALTLQTQIYLVNNERSGHHKKITAPIRNFKFGNWNFPW